MRVSVPLAKSYRLLNHGPVTLISASHEGRSNVMAAAWAMPLDFDPPKLAVVVAADTFTRRLVEGSGELVVQVPTRAMVDLVWALGSESGAEIDKIAKHGVSLSPASQVGAPLVDGCIAWLEARVLPNAALATDHDLFLVEVVAAWADDEVFRDGGWSFDADAKRSLHHVAGGAFFATGEPIQARR